MITQSVLDSSYVSEVMASNFWSYMIHLEIDFLSLLALGSLAVCDSWIAIGLSLGFSPTFPVTSIKQRILQ